MIHFRSECDQSIVTQPSAEKTALIADAGVLTKVALPSDTPHLLAIMEKLIEKGGSVEQMGQILALQERWEANEARKAFFRALAEFKKNPPEILKAKTVRFETAKGVVEYKHATLGELSEKVGAALSAVGLSHRWATNQSDAGMVEVTCILAHELGHSERTTLRSMPDASGSKNSIQAVASAVSYLERYTLHAAIGVASQDTDDDGLASNGVPALVTEAQANELAGMVESRYVSEAELGRFKTWLKAFAGVESVDRAPAAKFEGLKMALAGIPTKTPKKGGA